MLVVIREANELFFLQFVPGNSVSICNVFQTLICEYIPDNLAFALKLE